MGENSSGLRRMDARQRKMNGSSWSGDCILEDWEEIDN